MQRLARMHWVDARLPRYPGAVELVRLLRQAAACEGATVVDQMAADFEPQGATAVLLLAESHLAAHTWPEHDRCTIDALTCGDVSPQRMVEACVAALEGVAVAVGSNDRALHG